MVTILRILEIIMRSFSKLFLNFGFFQNFGKYFKNFGKYFQIM